MQEGPAAYIKQDMETLEQLTSTDNIPHDVWHVVEDAIAKILRNTIPNLKFKLKTASKKSKKNMKLDGHEAAKVKTEEGAPAVLSNRVIRTSYYKAVSPGTEWVVIAPVLMVLAGRGHFKRSGLQAP
jgi:hypothetical protein